MNTGLSLFGGFVLILCVVLGFAFCSMIKEENRAEKEFMTECVQYHKQFECTAMWRRANPPSDTTTVTPIIITQ